MSSDASSGSGSVPPSRSDSSSERLHPLARELGGSEPVECRKCLQEWESSELYLSEQLSILRQEASAIEQLRECDRITEEEHSERDTELFAALHNLSGTALRLSEAPGTTLTICAMCLLE